MESSDVSLSFCLYQPSVETKQQKLHENGTNSRGKRSKQTGLHNSDEDQTTTMGQRSIKSTKVPDTECNFFN